MFELHIEDVVEGNSVEDSESGHVQGVTEDTITIQWESREEPTTYTKAEAARFTFYVS